MSDAKAQGLPRLVPREQARNWQRWQAASLHEFQLGQSESVQTTPAGPTAEELAQQAEIERAAAAERELQALRDAAIAEGKVAGHQEGLAAGHSEGFSLGKQQGYDEGYAAGLAQGQQEIHTQAQALAALLQQAHDTLVQLEANVPDALARLALRIATKVVGYELSTDPESIIRLCQQLLHEEPVSDGVVKLHLHPDDAMLVAAQLGPTLNEHAWRIVSDDSITRGGCRLLTPLGELDATLQTRWERTCTAAGLEPPWALT